MTSSLRIALGALALPLAALAVARAEIPAGERRSGAEFMSKATQSMQADDTSNPGMFAALDGETLWSQKAGAAGKSCADCHGAAETSMRGVSARYPAFHEQSGRPVDVQGRVNICRQENQRAEPFPYESARLLALATYIGLQSRGMPAAPPRDERLASSLQRGEALWRQRFGQLNFSCAQCHDDNWGRRLGSAPIPQAHPNGYPIYRLEWQAVGSLQRRFRNCMTGVRAQPYPFGAPEFVDLELFLMHRAAGMPMETPGVRP